MKEEIREDSRYKAVARAEREQVFNDFLAKWKGGKESEVEVRAGRKQYEFLCWFGADDSDCEPSPEGALECTNRLLNVDENAPGISLYGRKKKVTRWSVAFLMMEAGQYGLIQ